MIPTISAIEYKTVRETVERKTILIQEKLSQNNIKHSVIQPFLDSISKNVELADVLFILAELY